MRQTERFSLIIDCHNNITSQHAFVIFIMKCFTVFVLQHFHQTEFIFSGRNSWWLIESVPSPASSVSEKVSVACRSREYNIWSSTSLDICSCHFCSYREMRTALDARSEFYLLGAPKDASGPNASSRSAWQTAFSVATCIFPLLLICH